MPTPAALQFPHSRVLLARTRLAYVHLRNLLTDAKRDRAARISGYVAVSLLDELVLFYLLNGEVANASVRDPRGSRAIAIASALEKVPHEPEYGECCFHEASPDELACIFAAETTAPEPWPTGMNARRREGSIPVSRLHDLRRVHRDRRQRSRELSRAQERQHRQGAISRTPRSARWSTAWQSSSAARGASAICA